MDGRDMILPRVSRAVAAIVRMKGGRDGDRQNLARAISVRAKSGRPANRSSKNRPCQPSAKAAQLDCEKHACDRHCIGQPVGEFRITVQPRDHLCQFDGPAKETEPEKDPDHRRKRKRCTGKARQGCKRQHVEGLVVHPGNVDSRGHGEKERYDSKQPEWGYPNWYQRRTRHVDKNFLTFTPNRQRLGA